MDKLLKADANYENVKSIKDLDKLFPKEFFEEYYNQEDKNVSRSYWNSIANSLTCIHNYYVSEENIEFLSNIAAAILLEVHKLYPELKAEIIFRSKSERSYVNNCSKSFRKENIDNPHDFFEDLIKDILGLKLIISPPDDITSLLNNKKYNEYNIKELICESVKNSVAAWNAKLYVEDKNKKTNTRDEFFPLYKEVLERLKECVYEEEKSMIDYLDSLPKHKKDFDRKIKPEDKKLLKKLAGDLSKRSSDKLLNHIGEQLLIKVCSYPIIKDTLKATCEIESAKKATKGWFRKSGFVAFFTTISSTLLNPDGLPIEGQFYNSFRFDIASSTHNTSYDSSKKADIKDCFMLKDNSGDEEKDKETLEQTLKALDKYSLATIRKIKNKEDKKRTEREKQILETSNELLEKICIDKNKLKIISQKEASSFDDSPNFYIERFVNPALHYFSPRMYSAKIGHRSDGSTYVVRKKHSILDCFSDVLRKEDEISILDYQLIEYLRNNYPELDDESYNYYTYESIENYAKNINLKKEKQTKEKAEKKAEEKAKEEQVDIDKTNNQLTID